MTRTEATRVTSKKSRTQTKKFESQGFTFSTQVYQEKRATANRKRGYETPEDEK